ncbi:MAG TPA: hypothetical protein VGI82_07375, partial [Chitinophagaceae bacterium]
GDGAFGQFMIVMPEQDAVIAITAETPNMQEEINLVWQYLLPAFKENKLPADAVAVARLKEKINALALPLPQKNKETPGIAISGKNFVAVANKLHLQNISFKFSNDLCKVKFQTDGGSYSIDFSDGKWQLGETNMPGPSLTANAIENTSMLYPAKIAGSYSWKDPNTLELVLRYIESPHSEKLVCHFQDNKLTIEVMRSIDFGSNKMTIEAEGKMKCRSQNSK